MDTQRSLLQIDERVRLFTYLNVREDAPDLLGFYTMTGLNYFKMLASVSDVDAKVGASTLSELSPEQVALAMTSGDSKTPSHASGVGPKLTQRVALELEGKVKEISAATVSAGDTTVNPAIGNAAGAVSALMMSGWSPTEVAQIVGRLNSSLLVEELIRLPSESTGGGRQDMEFSFENELDPGNCVVAPDYNPENVEVENPLRPCQLSEYIGQQKVKENLAVFVETAKQREETLDHVLLHGPSGSNKTTLAGVIASEMGVGVRVTSDPTIGKSDDPAATLTNLSPGSVLFTGKVYRLSCSAGEILYPAMGDFAFDIITGKGQATASYHLSLPPFTLVDAIIRAGQFSTPLRNRFGIVSRLELYSLEGLTQVVIRSARILGVSVEPEDALELASRSRGTSRTANRLLRRVRDFAQVISGGVIVVQAARRALERLEVNEIGLDVDDHRMLRTMIEYYRDGPVGLDMLVVTIGEEPVTLRDVYEFCLIQIGLLSHTPRGCCMTRSAYLHLGLTPSEDLADAQQKLF